MFMQHPKSGPVVEVTQAAFDQLWKDKGWVEVDEDQARAELAQLADAELVPTDPADEPFDVTTASFRGTTAATLAAAAEARGLDSTGTKADLWARLGGSDPS